MEIIPSPPVRRRRRGRLSIGAIASAFVLLGILAAVPVVLGQQRMAMGDDAMGATLPRGSYVLLRQLRPSEVEVGDVVSVDDPAGDGAVVRRVAALEGGWLELRGDASGATTTVRAVRVREVVRHVPWVGYPLLLLGPWPAPYLLLALIGAAVLAGLRLTRRGSHRPPPVATVSSIIPRQATRERPSPASAPPLPPAPRGPVVSQVG